MNTTALSIKSFLKEYLELIHKEKIENQNEEL